MASVAAIPKAAFNNVLFSSLLAASVAAVLVSGFQFQVGEEMGWTKPTGKEPKTYNEWAAQNRFHVGDTVCKFTNNLHVQLYSATNSWLVHMYVYVQENSKYHECSVCLL